MGWALCYEPHIPPHTQDSCLILHGRAKTSLWGMITPSFLAHVAWEAWIQPALQAWTQKPELGHSDLFTTRPMTQTQLIKTFHETFTKS